MKKVYSFLFIIFIIIIPSNVFAYGENINYSTYTNNSEGRFLEKNDKLQEEYNSTFFMTETLIDEFCHSNTNIYSDLVEKSEKKIENLKLMSTKILNNMEKFVTELGYKSRTDLANSYVVKFNNLSKKHSDDLNNFFKKIKDCKQKKSKA